MVTINLKEVKKEVIFTTGTNGMPGCLKDIVKELAKTLVKLNEEALTLSQDTGNNMAKRIDEEEMEIIVDHLDGYKTKFSIRMETTDLF